MAFVQIIDFRTSKRDEMRKLVDEWERTTEGKRLTTRAVMCQDRDDPDRFFNIVFFDSYEDAMKNSELPETSALAGKMMAISDGEPSFHNLDIVDDRS